MIDARFYEQVGAPTAEEIASAVGGTVLAGSGARIAKSLASALAAREGDLSFLEAATADTLAQVSGGVCLVPPGTSVDAVPASATLIGVRGPRAAFARASAMIIVLREVQSGPGAQAVHPSARIHNSALIEPGCVIGADVAIGARTRIGANSVLGPGVQIGEGCRIGARVAMRCALIGDRVQLASGVVIGESGFGVVTDDTSAMLVAHFGRVIIQNGVSIGSNSTVDRGFLADTVIGEGAQFDNLCHIAHNVTVGRSVVMPAYGGISGSSEVGDGVVCGGAVRIADHVVIGAGARIGAVSAVMRDIPAGETHAGYPAKPIRQWLRELAWVAQQAQKRSGGKSE